jgi:hypothetical protein
MLNTARKERVDIKEAEQAFASRFAVDVDGFVQMRARGTGEEMARKSKVRDVRRLFVKLTVGYSRINRPQNGKMTENLVQYIRRE